MVAWWGGSTDVVPRCLQWWKRLWCGAGAMFSNTHTRITCRYWSVRGRICNVMVEEGRCIKFFSVVYIRRCLCASSFTYVVFYMCRNLLLASRDGDRGVRWWKITPPPIFFLIFGSHRHPVNLSAPLPSKPKKLWRIPVRHYKIH